MRFNHDFQIHLSASTDAYRPHLNGVYLDAEKGRLVATNGTMLASVPCEVEHGDEAGILPADAIKAARKVAGAKGEPGIACNGSAAVHGGASYPRDKDVQFPPYEKVVPAPSPEDEVVIGLDAALLLKLAKSLGSKGHVRLTIRKDDPLHPIRVEPTSGEDAFGILMPVRV